MLVCYRIFLIAVNGHTWSRAYILDFVLFISSYFTARIEKYTAVIKMKIGIKGLIIADGSVD